MSICRLCQLLAASTQGVKYPEYQRLTMKIGATNETKRGRRTRFSFILGSTRDNTLDSNTQIRCEVLDRYQITRTE